MRQRGVYTEFFHNWDSFLPGMRWRDFCLVHLSGEWNPAYGQIEWTIALLGFWYRGTYVYNPDTPELRELRRMIDELEAQHNELPRRHRLVEDVA